MLKTVVSLSCGAAALFALAIVPATAADVSETPSAARIVDRLY